MAQGISRITDPQIKDDRTFAFLQKRGSPLSKNKKYFIEMSVVATDPHGAPASKRNVTFEATNSASRLIDFYDKDWNLITKSPGNSAQGTVLTDDNGSSLVRAVGHYQLIQDITVYLERGGEDSSPPATTGTSLVFLSENRNGIVAPPTTGDGGNTVKIQPFQYGFRVYGAEGAYGADFKTAVFGITATGSTILADQVTWQEYTDSGVEVPYWFFKDGDQKADMGVFHLAQSSPGAIDESQIATLNPKGQLTAYPDDTVDPDDGFDPPNVVDVNGNTISPSTMDDDGLLWVDIPPWTGRQAGDKITVYYYLNGYATPNSDILNTAEFKSTATVPSGLESTSGVRVSHRGSDFAPFAKKSGSDYNRAYILYEVNDRYRSEKWSGFMNTPT